MELGIKGLNLKSDFEMRKISDDGTDVDIFIDTGGKTLNMVADGMPEFIASRIQFCMVRGVLARFSSESSVCMLHILRSIDLHSAIANFEVDFSKCDIQIRDLDSFAQIEIVKKD